MIKSKCLFLIILFLNVAYATEENRGWLGIFSRKLSEDKVYYTHQELQIRYDLERGESQQLLARFGLLKSIYETQEIGLLLSYIETGSLIEYRPTLHHLYMYKKHRLIFSLRSRFEWRDWQNRSENSVRTRFQISFVKPISSVISVLFWDEPFINLTKDKMSGERTFERNRAFIGIRKFLHGHQVEYGYLNQFVPRGNDLTEHIAVVYLYF